MDNLAAKIRKKDNYATSFSIKMGVSIKSELFTEKQIINRKVLFLAPHFLLPLGVVLHCDRPYYVGCRHRYSPVAVLSAVESFTFACSIVLGIAPANGLFSSNNQHNLAVSW